MSSFFKESAHFCCLPFLGGFFCFFLFLVEWDDGFLSFSFMVPAIIKILTLAQVFIPQRWKHLRSVFLKFFNIYIIMYWF